VGLRINGENFWDFEDMDEVDFEPLFRQYKVWIPISLIEKINPITVEPISRKADSHLLFKPAMKEMQMEKKELNKNVGVNFKVIEGMIIQGKTMPPVAGVDVII
jgi:hypothetical protein